MQPNRFVVEVPVKPMTMPRPRAKAGQQAYYPPRYKAWREEMIWKLRSAWNKVRKAGPLTGNVRVSIALGDDRVALWIDPSPVERGRLKGDVDNYAKAVLDCLQDAGIITDDSQVVELVSGFIRPRVIDDDT